MLTPPAKRRSGSVGMGRTMRSYRHWPLPPQKFGAFNLVQCAPASEVLKISMSVAALPSGVATAARAESGLVGRLTTSMRPDAVPLGMVLVPVPRMMVQVAPPSVERYTPLGALPRMLPLADQTASGWVGSKKTETAVPALT